MVISLERGADLHMAQLMSLPLTVFCFSKIHIGFTFLVPAHLDGPGKRAVKRVCVCCWKEHWSSLLTAGLFHSALVLWPSCCLQLIDTVELGCLWHVTAHMDCYGYG